VPKPKHHVLVCLNARPAGNPKGSCAEKGAEPLFEALKAMVRERGLGDRVIVNRTSCLKHCSRGITVAVQPDNVWYAGVRESDLEEICSSHLQQGLQVMLQIAVVSQPLLRFEIQSHRYVLIRDLECVREASQAPQRAMSQVFGLFNP
jgi:(2Fe-2S) ferredoxin